MTDNLQAIINRAKTGALTPTDIQAIVAAVQAGQVTLATGQQAVGIGGSADESIIMTGSHNIVLNVTDTEAVLKILQQLNPLTGALQSLAPRSTLHQFPEVSRFDLIHLAHRCLGEFHGRYGLIGLAVPCDERAFLNSFCERLKHDLKRDKVQIQIRQTLSLKPQVISVNKAVEKIKPYKSLLQHSDVICPIRMEVYDSDSSIPDAFWQQIQDTFQNDFRCRLIIVIVGNQDCIFPKDALRLNPPRFEKVHAIEWIRDVTQTLSWGQVMDDWIRKMLDRCLCDVQTGCLDVGLVYEHLEYTLSLLQNNPSLSAEAFLEQLD